MDADLATPIEELEKLDAALNPERHVECAIGSRPLKESRLEVRQPWYREAGGRTFNKVVQLLATPGIADTQCGFKLLTQRAAYDIFSRCQLDGFSFDVEALFLARRLGYGIAEVPVRWAHQEGAAAFATRGAYLRHGLRMLSDVRRIHWIHRDVRPALSVAKTTSPRP
jgi:dolichyl-phosphate beta-glucosyltransferase